MNAKLISIFTVAGVVTAGSTAFAINSHTLKNPTQHSVGTASVNQTKLPEAPQQSPVNPAQDELSLPTNESSDTAVDAGTPATDTTGTMSDGGQNPATQQDQPSDSTSRPSTETSNPDPTSSLPTVPPNFKPGQDDDDEGEYEDDSDDDEHEDSEYEDDWEHEDD